MGRISKLLGVILITLLATHNTAAASGLPPDILPLKRMEGHYYFLGYNLHADMLQNKVSSVNYQLQGALLPWGTEVRIIRFQRNHLLFEDVGKGKRYRYEFHYKTRRSVPLAEHLGRVFLENPDGLRRQLEGMSEIDRDGIYEGRVKLGMSRDAVLIAIGYPPEFANRQALMTDRDWTYWLSRFSKMVVGFGRDGRVNRITGDY
jgi:hypothetical protein